MESSPVLVQSPAEVLLAKGTGVCAEVESRNDAFHLLICDGAFSNLQYGATPPPARIHNVLKSSSKLQAEVYHHAGYVPSIEDGMRMTIMDDEEIGWTAFDKQTDHVVGFIKTKMNRPLVSNPPKGRRKHFTTGELLNITQIIENVSTLPERLTRQDVQVLEDTGFDKLLGPDYWHGLLGRFFNMEVTGQAYDKPSTQRGILRMMRKTWNGCPDEYVLALNPQRRNAQQADIQNIVKGYFLDDADKARDGIEFSRFVIDPTVVAAGRGIAKYTWATDVIREMQRAFVECGKGSPDYITQITLFNEALLQYTVSVMEEFYGENTSILCLPIGNYSSGDVHESLLEDSALKSYFGSIRVWVLACSAPAVPI
jgi:hypothetical protein